MTDLPQTEHDGAELMKACQRGTNMEMRLVESVPTFCQTRAPVGRSYHATSAKMRPTCASLA